MAQILLFLYYDFVYQDCLAPSLFNEFLTLIIYCAKSLIEAISWIAKFHELIFVELYRGKNQFMEIRYRNFAHDSKWEQEHSKVGKSYLSKFVDLNRFITIHISIDASP